MTGTEATTMSAYLICSGDALFLRRQHARIPALLEHLGVKFAAHQYLAHNDLQRLPVFVAHRRSSP